MVFPVLDPAIVIGWNRDEIAGVRLEGFRVRWKHRTARKSRKTRNPDLVFESIKIEQGLRYNRSTEQMFFHYPDGRFLNVPIILRGRRNCSDGTSYDEYAPATPPAAGHDAVIHTPGSCIQRKQAFEDALNRGGGDIAVATGVICR